MKVGIDPWRDVARLAEKYEVYTEGTLDLRFMAEECGEIPRSLQFLAVNHLGMNLEKGAAMHYFWEDDQIDSKLVKYAAEDAFASIELFKYFANRLRPGRLPKMIKCIDVLGRDCTDEKFVYNSERYNVKVQSEGKLGDGVGRSGFGGGGFGGGRGSSYYASPQARPMMQHTDEDEQRSQSSSGLGYALAAGALALGGFLYYKSTQRP